MLLGVIILVFLFLVILSFAVYLFDSTFGGLDFTTSPSVRAVLVNIIKLRNLQKGIFYDLGSAKGEFATKLAKVLPGLKITGVDNNMFRVLFSRLRGIFLKNLIFKKGNIFQANFSSADITYIYLPQELMPNLEIKLQKELKPGALVISNSVSFPSWQPIQRIDKLFIYQI